MTEPTLLFPSVEAARAAAARARAAQQRAIARGASKFEPEPEPVTAPAWRRRLAEDMPYPGASLGHMDSETAGTIQAWLEALAKPDVPLGGKAAGNLLLLGRAGTGKTVVACAVATHLADEAGWRVAYSRTADLLADERPDGSHTLRGHLLGMDAVVLDDLAVSLTEWGADVLTSLVDELVHPAGGHDGALVIVTANYPPVDLAEMLPERLWSRLSTGGWTIIFDGDDRRGEALPPMPKIGLRSCPHGCDRGWLRVDAAYVDRWGGPIPDDDKLDAAVDEAYDRLPETLTGQAAEDFEAAVRASVLAPIRERRATAAATVRPCPYCRPAGRAPTTDNEDPE